MFLKKVASEPRGMYAIAKSALYNDSVLTLSCKPLSSVSADEFFTSLRLRESCQLVVTDTEF